MNSNDSSLLLAMLRWLCPPELYEGIEGDLLEAFQEDTKAFGLRSARRRFLINVLRFVRPGILLRNKFSTQLIDTMMLRNYFIVTFRNVARNKIYSTINIFGLAFGMAACLLITKFFLFELSYDKFHSSYENIYRVINDRYQNGKLIQHGTITYPAVGPAMAKDFPEIETYSRMMPAYDLTIKCDKGIFTGDHGFLADEHFFSIFSFPLIVGTSSTALKEPHTTVLTEKLARKYFGIKDRDYASVIDKVIYWGTDPQPYRVTGICKDVPQNSHLQFDILFSYITLVTPDNPGPDNSWTWSDMFHYVLLKPGSNQQMLEAKLDAFSERYFQGEKVSGSTEKFYLQPLREAHLYSDFEYDFAKKANGNLIWSLAVVATLVLVMALVNYINLTTSRSLDRAKEVGVRKVMGAVRLQLVKQFTFESILMCSIALIAALCILQLTKPLSHHIMAIDPAWSTILFDLSPAALAIFFSLITGAILVSGLLPALTLSAFQPATVLKGKVLRSARSGGILRKGLVFFQFITAAVMITGTVIVSRQLSYMNEAELGVDISNIIVIQPPSRTPWDSTFIERVESYKHELNQVNGVIGSTVSNLTPGARLGRVFDVRSVGSAAANVTLSFMAVDDRYFDNYAIDLIAGRNFTRTDFHQEWKLLSNAVINASAAKLLGIGDSKDAPGSEIQFWGKQWKIVGVVSDFHQESLKNPKEPMVFIPAYNEGSVTSVKINSNASIAQMESIFLKFFPGNAFEYFHLEEKFKAQYQDDNRFGKIIKVFAGLAIIISCLGLVALSSHTASQRTREIGIRKSMGASLSHVVALLSFDFLKVISVAVVLSVPISWFAMQRWLERYSYHISPGWMAFILPVIIILIIATLTIGAQVLSAAKTNPATILKHE